MQSSDLYKLVQSRYGELAERSSAAGEERPEEGVAKAFGYEASDLDAIPEDANLGVGCGNPLAVANIREGESVIDLGSGGGIDVLLAAKKVGPNGRSIGVDMTKSMLDLGRKNAEKAGATNVTFIESSITSIPLPESTINCIISNCVVNLVPAPEKPVAFKEMFRLLAPGGRVAISDILTRTPMPDEVANDLSLYVGCISSASQIHEYEEYMRDAGFKDIVIVDTKKDLNVFKGMFQDQKDNGPPLGCCPPKPSSSSCCGSKPAEANGGELLARDFNEWAGSFQIYAIKP
ncbi:Methyltransferase [Aspergillus sp. HF37]|nr:Methyltransferase [Aspergillus sp. HF37]